MSLPASCPICGAVVPDGAPEGLCPRCLLGLARSADTAPSSSSDPTLHTEKPASQRPATGGFPSSPSGDGFKAGTTVGDYELLREVGRGGMGVVYEARHTGLKRKVALKVLPWSEFASDEQRERFRREAEAAARLHHPHIVSVFEWGNHDGCPFMAMQLVEDARSLADEIAHGPLRPRDAVRILATVARAVHYSHQHGVLHRDIKPGNILLNAKGEPLLVDFGLARLEDAAFKLTRPDLVFGTPAYMPPEQATGEEITTAGDVYSLGSVLYEALTGKPAFRGRTVAETMRQVVERDPAPPRSLRPDLDRDLNTVVLKRLEKNQARRYSSADALAEDLERWLADWPVRARPVTITVRAVKWARRRPAVAGLMVALVLTALLGFTGILLNWQRAVAARKEQTVQLWQSLLSEAQARRSSHRSGQRFAAIESLQRAAAIRPSIELQNEAVSSLAISDLRPAEAWEGDPEEQDVIALTPDFRHTAFARKDGTLEVCERVGMKPVATLSGTGTAPMQRLHFSPDGRWLAAGCGPENGACAIVVWDWKNNREILRLNEVSGMAFAFWPDGSRVAACIGKELLIQRLPGGGMDRPPVPLPAMGAAISVSASGRRVVVSMVHERETSHGPDVLPEGRMMLLDMQDPALKPTWLNNPVPVRLTSWHPHEDWLAVPGRDQTIRIWDARTGKVRQTITGAMDMILEAAWSPQGDLIASRSMDGAVKLWDASSGEHYVSVPGSVRTLQFSADGSRLGVDYDGTMTRLFEVAPLMACRRLPGLADGPVMQARWNHDGSLLAAAGHHVRFWNSAGHLLGEIPHFDLPRSVIFLRDAVIVSGAEGVWRWPLRIEKADGTLRAVLGEPDPITRERGQQFAAMSADERLLAVARENGVALYNLKDLTAPPRLLPGPAAIHIAISPDGHMVATDSLGSDSAVWVRETAGGGIIRRLPVTGGASISFTVDGRHLITGGRTEFCCWDAASWKPVATHPCQGAVNGSIALSPRGTAAAIGCTPQRTKIVMPTTFATVGEPDCGPHAPLCFSPDGSLFLTSDLMGCLFLWDMAWIRHEVARLKLDWNFRELPSSHAPLVEEMVIPGAMLSPAR